MEADKSIICSVGSQTRNPKVPIGQMKTEGSLPDNSLLLEKVSLCVLFRPSADWMRPTHIMEGNLFYSKFTNINVNVIQNTLQIDTKLIITPLLQLLKSFLRSSGIGGYCSQKSPYHNPAL